MRFCVNGVANQYKKGHQLLVAPEMIRLYESHMHTPLCKHARGNPGDYAAVAESRGLSGIIVTCHNPLPDGLATDSRMDPWDLDEYLTLVSDARDQWRGRIDVRLGLECDFAPFLVPWLTKQIDLAPFDFILGSIHPHLAYYQERFWQGNPVAFQRQYFEHLAEAAETGLFDSLAHPDLVKNTTCEHWQLDRVIDCVRRSLDRIAAAGVAMELNTSGWNKAIPEINPSPSILAEMAKRNIPVTLGSDAHDPERVADRWELALDELEKAGYQSICVFLDRQAHEVNIDVARASLIEVDTGSSVGP